MPVRDLTDRPRVPRAGKIRLGEKVPNASGTGEHPVARPYFVCPPEVIEALGDEEPTVLPIVFLDDDEELINSQWYRLYNFTHGRVCRGDGFSADALLDADVIKAREGDLTPNDRDMWAHGGTRGRQPTQNVLSARIECLGAGYEGKPACPMFERGTGCSVKAFMQFAIRGVPQLAVYQLDTGSVIGIANVNGLIHQLKQLTGGRIAGIPLLLKRIPVDVREPSSMKMVSQQSITLELDPIVTRTNLLSIAAQPVARVLLPAPDESDAIDIFADEEDDRSLAERTGHQVVDSTVVKHEAPQEAVDLQGDPPASDSAPAPSRTHEATQETPVSASAGATEIGPAPSTPPAPSPTRAPSGTATPINLLNDIEKRHGQAAKVAAINVMTRLYGTGVVNRLDSVQMAQFVDILRVRLEQEQHEHELLYTAQMRPVCMHCGEEMDDSEQPAATEPAAAPA